MADADYRAWVEVLPDFQQFNQQVQSGVVGGMAGAGSAGSAAMGGALVAGIGKFALPIAGAIAGLGIASSITNAIQDGINAGIDYIKQSVATGSDYNESLNAIAVAYGDFAAQIGEISKSSATDLGLSQLDFNAIATQFSAFAKTIQRDNPVGFIKDLSQRGADFASVFNIDVSEALRLFQSGLAGETEPLRRYGIDLSAATVAGFAYANGIAEQGKQLTETQRQQAAYGALMQQTSMVQGDFANTSDQLANRQRILQAQWADAQAQLGLQLLPVLQEVLSFVSGELMPAWIEFNEQLGPALKDALEDAWPDIQRLIETVLPLLVAQLPVLIRFLELVIDTVQDWSANNATLLRDLNALFQLLSGDISLPEFIDRLLDGAGSMSDFGNSIGETVAGIIQDFARFTVGVKQSVDSAIVFVVSLPSRALGALGDLGSTLYSAGRSLIGGFISGMLSMLTSAGNAVNSVLEYVAGFFPHSPAVRGVFAGAGWVDVRNAGAAIMAQFQAGLTPVDVPLGLTPPTVAPIGRGAVMPARVADTGETILNFTGTDPYLVWQLAKRELAGRLAIS